jgi:hypothetical protein
MQDGVKPDDDSQQDLPEQIGEDIGGVQGTDPDEAANDESVAVQPGSTPDAPAPDAGEIEWAGQLVKKPPTPAA